MLATASESGSLATTIEAVVDSAGFSRLENQWNRLLESSDSDCLFLTWEWLFTWWKQFSDGRRLSILALRSGDELVAVAPLCMNPSNPSRGQILPALQFLGTGNVGSDYLDMIVQRGYEKVAAQGFADRINQSGLALQCAQLRRHEAASYEIARSLDEKRWILTDAATNVCPYIPLDGCSWNSYLASLGAEHRYGLNRKWKRLNRDFAVRIEEVKSESQCERAIEATIQLHNLRWTDRGRSNAFDSHSLTDFHREFSMIALRRGWLRLYLLRLDEQVAACLYGFFYRGKFYFYQSGFRPAFERHSPGFLLLGYSIRRAIEEGAFEYDLLHGDEAYKFHWTAC